MPTSIYQNSLASAQLRAVAVKMGLPSADAQPAASILAALVKHGGMYTLLDPDMMTARVAAFVPQSSASSPAAGAIVAAAQEAATNYFYKLVADRPGYTIHSELMAYLSEPGKNNGVTYNEGVQPSDAIPAAFTFVGQFIDHDLTFNPMNLTADENGVVVQDDASPLIDLDHVYGPRPTQEGGDPDAFFKKIFDEQGNFRLTPIEGTKGFDVPRHTDPTNASNSLAYIYDPRNDENQLILQVHILVERLHNKIRNDKKFAHKLHGAKHVREIVNRVRREVVATWQSFVLNDYMVAILDESVREHVLTQIRKGPDPAHCDSPYGDLKHKPLKDLVTCKNIVRMPHEFAIGFRFGHSQLRPFYLLNQGNLVLLFKDARHSDVVDIDGTTLKISGKNDLRGSRPLSAGHVIDWHVFYPNNLTEDTASMRIDGKVTARVFNLPETAIPDDVKYIGNLPHRNLIRSSQIGIVSGEELADFYGITEPKDRLSPEQITEGNKNAVELFRLDKPAGQKEGPFKTPIWYYLLKEAEIQKDGSSLGIVGSHLVGEVLAGALYYGNEFPYEDNWTSSVFPSNVIKLHDIIDYVLAP